jgi:Eukaryotic aspartyl protease
MNLFALPSHLLRFDIILRAQTFNLVLDTGSSDLWFASSGCAGCSPNTPVLNPQSSSLQLGTQRISLDYGSGSASGVIARDTVTLGPFTVNPQTFGVYFPSPHFRFYLSLPLPRVCRVFYSLLARVTNAKLCFVRWHLMAISNGRRKVEPLISNQLRSKCAIDRPFVAFCAPLLAFPSALLTCTQLPSMICLVG